MRKPTSTNLENEINLTNFCNGSRALLLINGRWKLPVLFFLLNNNTGTFSDFIKLLPDVSDRMLALHLKEMISDDLIVKKKNGTSLTYYLTDKGISLKPVLNSLADWNTN
ncbi:DNA-binding HxlR family transcriptional regulator [Flavobacterium sp. HSC-32F16]|uniref:winged helix-turn-helix transcriptional regulator n=1 Tax=Flavobacterium sp. HSC-32F16 TaxID=2910964 RepID=UPI0020A421C8|nr:helix-turn-helix domain-containing protein [Flavobacterium sp. HSC-32F16]MCP2025335.1 DNA-binding HxlR family transcriptional regulator [Flavobacterium sp. HSC-32F16]